MMNKTVSQLSNGAPFALVENLYDEKEEKEILAELRYLYSRKDIWLDPEDSGTAVDLDTKKPLKDNKCIWMNHIYKQSEASAILTHNMKLYTSGMAEQLAEDNPWFKYLIHNSEFSTLLSYYETGQHYKAHRDRAVLTTLTWFYEDPKSFSGGEIILENEATIKCLSNCMLIIPSTTLHEVLPVILSSENESQGKGRYTITTFINIQNPTVYQS